MANKKISQLSATTEANDNVWLIINNSGETETFKIKRSDLVAGVDTAGLVSGTGSNSMKSNDDLTANAATAQQSYSIVLGDNASDTAAAGGGIAIGRNASAGGNTTGIAIGTNTSATGRGFHIGNGGNANGDGAVGLGLNNTATKETAIAIGQDVNVTGNFGIGMGRLTDTNAAKSVSIGFSNDITNANPNGGDGEGNAILAGYSNDISSTGKINTIVGGDNNVLSGTTSGTTLIGLTNFTSPTNDNTTYVDKLYSVGSKITAAGGLIVGGVDNNSIGASSDFTNNAIINSYNSTITSTNSGGGNSLLGAYNSVIQDNSLVGTIVGADGTIKGGGGNLYNGIYSCWEGEITSGRGQGIFGGKSQTITNGDYNTLLGGEASQITSSTHSSIVGGKSNTISSHDYSVILGGNGMTSVYDNTAHAENIHIYGTESKNTITGQTASGATTIDLSVGSVFEVEMIGNVTSLTFTNWREGGMYEFVVFNNGSYTVTAAGVTLDGVSNTVAAKAGSVNPTNNQRTLYRMLIVNGKGYLNEHLNFQFM